MTPQIQQTETAPAFDYADFAALEISAASIEAIPLANDNFTGTERRGILAKRRRRHARLAVRRG